MFLDIAQSSLVVGVGELVQAEGHWVRGSADIT